MPKMNSKQRLQMRRKRATERFSVALVSLKMAGAHDRLVQQYIQANHGNWRVKERLLPDIERTVKNYEAGVMSLELSNRLINNGTAAHTMWNAQALKITGLDEHNEIHVRWLKASEVYEWASTNELTDTTLSADSAHTASGFRDSTGSPSPCSESRALPSRLITGLVSRTTGKCASASAST